MKIIHVNKGRDFDTVLVEMTAEELWNATGEQPRVPFVGVVLEVRDLATTESRLRRAYDSLRDLFDRPGAQAL